MIMENFFLKPASDECTFYRYEDVKSYFAQHAPRKKVKLGIIKLNEAEIVWYVKDKTHMQAIPAFNNADVADVSPSNKPLLLAPLSPNDYFFRHGKLYYADEEMTINRVKVIWQQSMALLWADIAEIKPSSCILSNVYDEKHFFLYTAWVIDDKNSSKKLFIPLFMEEVTAPKNKRPASPGDVIVEEIHENDIICHGTQLWLAVKDKEHGFHVEPTASGLKPRRK